MVPIVSPWLVYAVWLANALRVCAGVVLACAAFYAFVVFMTTDCEHDAMAARACRRALLVAASCVAVLVLVPNRQTIFAMIALNYVTPDNIAVVQVDVVDFVKRIVDACR